jgi:hypothetical protein
MSRPTKNAKERRSRHVIFRLNEAEYAGFCALAARAGLAPNDLGRRLIRRGAKRLVVRAYRHCDPAFLTRLDRMGHNLNQLVKNAHIFGRVSPRIEPLCAAIDRLVMQATAEDAHDS